MQGEGEDGKRDVIKGKRGENLAKEEVRGIRRLETKTEGEKAPPLRSFSVLLALACGKCKAAG